MAKTKKKRATGILKLLEAVVLIGAVAGVLFKFFKGEDLGKKKKKKGK